MTLDVMPNSLFVSQANKKIWKKKQVVHQMSLTLKLFFLHTPFKKARCSHRLTIPTKLNKIKVKHLFYVDYNFTSLNTGNPPFVSFENTSFPPTVTSNEAVIKNTFFKEHSK